MSRNAFTSLVAAAALAIGLAACSSVKPAPDVLTGTWYQNGGQLDLIWDFHTDGTVAVHAWNGTGVQRGIYRHLQDNRVALDFGTGAASVVQINVTGKEMTMLNPGGARTVLKRN
jgi:hypothetical protein